ncbi:MAG: serine/threonine-protein kinase, partial [Polyangiales bacterium]
MTIGPGTLVNGKYRLGRQLGEGGMGAIFEARHEFLGTEVALKFLHPALSSRPNVVARFVQEARVSANMKSPHIVSVVDVDQSPEGLAFLVMELLRGEPLAGRLAREPVLPLSLTLNIAVQCLLALEIAHALGVVHRDMKPENVFLTDAPGQPGATTDGLLVKILDFGIAKLRTLGEVKAQLTKPGMVMGTPEYMAPEQVFSAEAVDARADIYALGAMIFEMLAGRRPVQGDDARAIAAVVLSGNTQRLDTVAPRVPKEIADVVSIALAAKPNDRFSSAGAMLRALVNAAKEASIPIEAPSPEKLAKKSLVPGKSGIGAAVGLGSVGLGVAPQAMFGPGDPAAMAAFDARARGELPAGLGVSGALHPVPDTRSSQVAPLPAGEKRDGRIETGTVAQVPDATPPPPQQQPHSDSTAFGAPSPYAPPYGDGLSNGPPVDATQSGGSTAPSTAYGATSHGTASPGDRTDAGMLSPYSQEG